MERACAAIYTGLPPCACGIKSLVVCEAALQNFICDIERR